jgi:putative signal transducing protein
MQHAELIVVKSCGNRLEAELAKGLLESVGIESMIQADTAGGMREHLAWSGAGFRILVRAEDATAARDALAPSTDGSGHSDIDSEVDSDSRPSWRRFT